MIVGRKREQKLLDKAFNSTKAQFVTIYGRRRVGKTYLVSEFFGHRNCKFMYVSGLQEGNMRRQLENFTKAISETFFENTPLEVPVNWLKAFERLHEQILKTQEKVVIFLDELPWMATRRSGLMLEIDHFWNRYWSKMPNVVLIVCGSSASWIMQKIIYNKGGLHNRTTIEIHVRPFKLADTKAYLEHNGIQLNEEHILSIYMALGGIPYYLDALQRGMSAQQNLQELFFEEDSPLREEFDKLFDSLFEDAGPYKEILKVVAQHKEGISRTNLAQQATGSGTGGRLTRRLEDLRVSGFLQAVMPWGKKTGEYYRVIDEFSLFYLRWVAPNPQPSLKNYWMIQSQKPTFYAWSEYAFEAVCQKHINAVTQALGIDFAQKYGWWRKVAKKDDDDAVGAQVDLVIERSDSSITLCEIKYTEKPFIIDKSYAAKLTKILTLCREEMGAEKQLFLAFISAHGLKKTIYSEKLVSGVVTLKDLFLEA